MYRISKEFKFSASHRLLNLPAAHPCSRLHGHNYKVKLVFCGNDLTNGMLIDYRDLKAISDHLDKNFDHQHLNDVLAVTPTAENIAFCIYQWAKAQWPELESVRVSEGDNTWAEWRPNV